MDIETAAKISSLMHNISGELAESVYLVAGSGSEYECTAYKLAVGSVMAQILIEVLNPLYRDFPHLKPGGFN